MKDLLIGLDLGTSSVKAGVFNRQGRALALAGRPLAVTVPHSGWAEQDPRAWWQGACEVLREVLRNIEPTRVAGLGLCGQCPGHVLVGENGEPLHPAIIWRDQRAEAEVDWLLEHTSPQQVQSWLGTRFVADPSLPPARLLWLKCNRPEIWARTRWVLQPKDFLGLKLTGVAGTDSNSAYSLAHPRTRQYPVEFFDLMGISPDLMPPVLEDVSAVLGEITPEAAGQTGLIPGIPVVVGTIDAWCDNLAGGVLFHGQAVEVAGTSEMVSMAASPQQGGEGVFLARIGEQAHFVVGPAQVGGETLCWLARGFYPEMSGTPDFEVLEQSARKVPPGSDGLVFLPYLSGERAPIWDAHARACFIGLTLTHGRQHCTRAAYEGVAFSVRHILETCEKATAARAEQIVVCGGGSRSRFWNQIKADVLQRPVRPAAIAESACLGAAILASVGVGVFGRLVEACREMIFLLEPVLPDPRTAEVYRKNYQVYLAAYPALKGLFQNLTLSE